MRYVELLLKETEMYLTGFKHRGYLLAPVNFMEGIQTTLPRMFGEPDALRYQSGQIYTLQILLL